MSNSRRTSRVRSHIRPGNAQCRRRGTQRGRGQACRDWPIGCRQRPNTPQKLVWFGVISTSALAPTRLRARPDLAPDPANRSSVSIGFPWFQLADRSGCGEQYRSPSGDERLSTFKPDPIAAWVHRFVRKDCAFRPASYSYSASRYSYSYSIESSDTVCGSWISRGSIDTIRFKSDLSRRLDSSSIASHISNTSSIDTHSNAESLAMLTNLFLSLRLCLPLPSAIFSGID